jgi:O-antigen/teichoic acid export membrane protein
MSSFASNVFKLSLGTLIAQALGLAVAPILSRLFAPEAFGLLGLFTSISGIIGAIACLRYELAIMLPREIKNAVNLFAGSLFSAALVSFLCAVFIRVAGNRLIILFNAEQLNEYVWLIPLMVFLVGTFSAANYWYSRTEHFGRLAFIRIINAFSGNALKLAMGFWGSATGGILILATFIGQFIANLILYIKIWFSDGQLLRSHFELKEMFNLFYRYKQFPQYSVWSGILVDFSLKLPIFMIAYFFSTKELGFFVFVQTIVRAPFNLLGESISKVFFQKAASIKENSEKLSDYIESVFYFLTTCFMLPALVLSFLGEDIFKVLFGSNWSEAGKYAQVLIFSILIEFITAPLGNLYNVLEKQKEALRFNMLLMALRLGALIIGGFTGKILIAIVIFVAADVIGRCAKFIYIFGQTRFKIAKAVAIIVKAFALAVPFIFFLILCKYVLSFSAIVNIWFAVLIIIINYFLLIHRNGFIKTFLINHSQSTSETY